MRPPFYWSRTAASSLGESTPHTHNQAFSRAIDLLLMGGAMVEFLLVTAVQ